MFLGIDDGLFSQNYTFADICFLIAVILFAIAAVVRTRLPEVVYGGGLIALGLTAVALGLLVL